MSFLSQTSLESPWQPAVCTGGDLDGSVRFGGAQRLFSNPYCRRAGLQMNGSFPGRSPSNHQLITWGEVNFPAEPPAHTPPPLRTKTNVFRMPHNAGAGFCLLLSVWQPTACVAFQEIIIWRKINVFWTTFVFNIWMLLEVNLVTLHSTAKCWNTQKHCNVMVYTKVTREARDQMLWSHPSLNRAHWESRPKYGFHFYVLS